LINFYTLLPNGTGSSNDHKDSKKFFDVFHTVIFFCFENKKKIINQIKTKKIGFFFLSVSKVAEFNFYSVETTKCERLEYWNGGV